MMIKKLGSILRRLRNLWVVLAASAIIALVVFFGLRKTVTLSMDGSSQTLTIYAIRVSDLLAAQHIALSPADELSPALGAWLKNGSTVSLVHAIPVQVLADGKLTSISSAKRVATELLTQAGVQLGPADQLLSNGRPVDPLEAFPESARTISLQLVRATRFTLNINGETQALTSTAPTLGSALWAAGYTLYADDQLDPSAGTPLTAGLSASLTHARLVTIYTAARSVTVRTAASTVGDALAAAHLSLQGLDYSIPPASQAIPASGTLQLVRVTEQVLVEQTPIPFETQFQADANLEIDSQAVIQAGEAGMNAQRIRVRYEDGVEASRRVESQWVARQPQTRIIGYGTALVMHTATVDGVEIQYWRVLTMYATSYHPSEGGDITASGLPLQKGIAAIDRSIVPFGTHMYIPGYGEALAADTGGGVLGRWIDLGYSDSDYVPWHSWVTVYFLWPPPDYIVWIVP